MERGLHLSVLGVLAGVKVNWLLLLEACSINLSS